MADLAALSDADLFAIAGLRGEAPAFDTPLAANEEQAFQAWKAQYAPRDSGADYDLRGAFKAGLQPGANGHWPDTFKKPNHPTFSNESIYAQDRPDLAGHWQGDAYVPPTAAPDLSSVSDADLVRVLVADEAQRQGVPSDLAVGVARAESGLNAQTKASDKGAIGTMQLMASTARGLGVDPHDPLQNIQGGVSYLKQQLDRYNGDVPKALAAYNAGPGNVDKYGGVPPFAETQAYVRNIQRATAPPSGPPLQANVGSIRSNPLTAAVDRGGRFEQSADINPQSLNRTFDVAAGTMMPVASTWPRLAAQTGGFSAALTARDAIAQKGWGAVSVDTLKDVAKSFGIGAGTSAALSGVNRAVFGARDPAREAAVDYFTERQSGPAWFTRPQGPPLASARGGEDLADFLGTTAREKLPQPDEAATDALYDQLRAAVSTRLGNDRPIDVSGIRSAIADAREAAIQAGYDVPKALNPNTLGAPATRVVNGVPSTVYEAPLDTVLKRMSVINRVKLQKAMGKEPSIDAADIAQVSHDVYEALRPMLTQPEQELLAQATQARLVEGQLSRVQRLIDSTQNMGVPNGRTMLNRLSNDRRGAWQEALGPFYGRAVEWAQNVAALQKTPEGREVFRAIIGTAAGAAGGAAASGMNPWATGFAGSTGFAAAFSPLATRSIERLARARPGSDQFLAEAGRLALAMMAGAGTASPATAPTPGPGAGSRPPLQGAGRRPTPQATPRGAPLRTLPSSLP